MHHSLGDALTVERRQVIDQSVVLGGPVDDGGGVYEQEHKNSVKNINRMSQQPQDFTSFSGGSLVHTLEAPCRDPNAALWSVKYTSVPDCTKNASVYPILYTQDDTRHGGLATNALMLDAPDSLNVSLRKPGGFRNSIFAQR